MVQPFSDRIPRGGFYCHCLPPAPEELNLFKAICEFQSTPMNWQKTK